MTGGDGVHRARPALWFGKVGHTLGELRLPGLGVVLIKGLSPFHFWVFKCPVPSYFEFLAWFSPLKVYLLQCLVLLLTIGQCLCDVHTIAGQELKVG